MMFVFSRGRRNASPTIEMCNRRGGVAPPVSINKFNVRNPKITHQTVGTGVLVSPSANIVAPRHRLASGRCSRRRCEPMRLQILALSDPYGNLLRLARLPTRKRRSNVSNPIQNASVLGGFVRGAHQQNKKDTHKECPFCYGKFC